MFIFVGFKVYNTADDKSNFTLTIHTQNIPCDRSNVVVYGDQVGPEHFASRLSTNTRHFTGGFTILKSMSTNFINQCKFAYNSEDKLHYVFIKIFATHYSNSKLCEILF